MGKIVNPSHTLQGKVWTALLFIVAATNLKFYGVKKQSMTLVLTEKLS